MTGLFCTKIRIQNTCLEQYHYINLILLWTSFKLKTTERFNVIASLLEAQIKLNLYCLDSSVSV
jgi:hypothetical protein